MNEKVKEKDDMHPIAIILSESSELASNLRRFYGFLGLLPSECNCPDVNPYDNLLVTLSKWLGRKSPTFRMLVEALKDGKFVAAADEIETKIIKGSTSSSSNHHNTAHPSNEIDKQKTFLRNNHVNLAFSTSNWRALVPHLREKKLISDVDISTITSLPECDNLGKFSHMYSAIIWKPNSFHELMDCLARTNNIKPLQILNGFDENNNIELPRIQPTPNFAFVEAGLKQVPPKTTRKALLFIDVSYAILGAKQHSSRIQDFRSEFREDGRRILDFGDLYACLKGGFQSLTVNLHASASEASLLNNNWGSIEKKDPGVRIERKVATAESNTGLLADVKAEIKNYRSEENIRVILYCSEKEALLLYKLILKNGWKVDIWGYRASLSGQIQRETNGNPNVGINFMDDCFTECTHLKIEWKKPHMQRESTVVLLFDATLPDASLLSRIVTECTKVLRIPLMSKMISSQNVSMRSRNMRRQYAASFALIFFNSKQRAPNMFFEDVLVHNKLQIMNALPNCREIMTYEQYLRCTQHNLNVNPNQQVRKEFPSGLNSKFGSNVSVNSLGEHGGSGTRAFSNLHSNVSSNQSINSLGEHGGGNRNHISVKCGFGFRCKFGSNCKNTHSPEEKELFKEHPTADYNAYKRQHCKHLKTQTCKYMDKSYLCLFAHNDFELTKIQ